MKELLIIAVGSALVNNVVLSQFLGICPFLGVSKKIETAAGMGGAVVFVIVFILVIAALVQFVEMFLKKVMPPLYNALGVYLPLITTNCAVLGVSLNCVTKGYNILEGVVYGFSTAVGFTIAIVIMAGIREKIEYNDRTAYSSTDVHRVLWILRNHLTEGGPCYEYNRSIDCCTYRRRYRRIHRCLPWNCRQEICS